MRISDVWFEEDVDADHPDMLANPYSIDTITKTFLDASNRNPSWTWPSNEVPYKLPTETAPEPDLDPDQDPDQDSDSDLDLDLDTDPTLPSPTLGKINFNEKNYKTVIPVTVSPENKGDPIIFYVQRPDQNALEIPIKASNSTSTSITISLAGENGKPPIPGNYIFQAAFKNRNGSGVGPLSRSVKLKLTE